MKVDDKDWSVLTLGERIQHLEMEGYVVLSGLLSAAEVAKFKKRTAALKTVGADYSDKQRTYRAIHWAGPVEPKIPAWDEQKVAALPPHVRRGFDFNHLNKPANMRNEAPGIAPRGWERR